MLFFLFLLREEFFFQTSGLQMLIQVGQSSTGSVCSFYDMSPRRHCLKAYSQQNITTIQVKREPEHTS